MTGSNIAVPSPETIVEYLSADSAEFLQRRTDLLASYKRAPEKVESEEIAQKMTDLIRQIAAWLKAMEAGRVAAKEPYLAGGKAVDSFYQNTVASLAEAKKDLEIFRLSPFLRAKADKERREREERARLAREEEERRAAEAAEAEKALADEASLNAAIAAEQRAKDAAADAERADKEAAAKASAMSQTRGEYGALSTLRTEWKHKDLDRAKLDLEALRAHLSTDCLDKAIRSFIKAGGRELDGATIYEATTAMVR